MRTGSLDEPEATTVLTGFLMGDFSSATLSQVSKGGVVCLPEVTLSIISPS